MIKESRNFMSSRSYHPAKFGGHGYSVSRDIMTLQDHVIRALCDLMVTSALR